MELADVIEAPFGCNSWRCTRWPFRLDRCFTAPPFIEGANLTQLSRTPFELPIHVTGRWSVALGETHALLVNGNGHMLVLVSIDTDDHLNSADGFATGDCCHFRLLKE